MEGWWVTQVLYGQGAVALFSWVVWVIGSIVLHELAHGWAAIWEGDDTPIVTGHVRTANPLVHMGVPSLVLFALVGFAFGAMPVNPYRFRHRRWGDAIVAAAGPAMNLGLAIVAAIGFGIVIQIDSDSQLVDNSLRFFQTGVKLNCALLILNLLPVPPLDGSKIAGGFVPAYRRLYERPDIAQGSMFLALFAIFIASSFIWATANEMTSVLLLFFVRLF